MVFAREFQLHLPMWRGNSSHWTLRSSHLWRGKVAFWTISVFLTDVIVERLRNEIERTSARPHTSVRLDEILTIHDSFSSSHELFPDLQDQSRSGKWRFELRRTVFRPISDQKRQVRRLCTCGLRRVYLPKKDRDADLRHIRICLHSGKIWVVCPWN